METNYITVEAHNEFAKRIDSENERQNARIKILEDTVREISRLTISVEKMAVNMENMANEQKNLGNRLEAIEGKPAKRWETIVSCVITGIVGAVIGALMSGIVS